jgi:hypothetical protein
MMRSSHRVGDPTSRRPAAGGPSLGRFVVCPATTIAPSGSIMSCCSPRSVIVVQVERGPFGRVFTCLYRAGSRGTMREPCGDRTSPTREMLPGLRHPSCPRTPPRRRHCWNSLCPGAGTAALAASALSACLRCAARIAGKSGRRRADRSGKSRAERAR